MNVPVEDLYQQLIIDHSRRPRNFRVMEGADRQLEGYNPLCGDKVTVYLRLDGDRITDASFQGSGCAISTASASLMTEAVKGKSHEQVDRLFEAFRNLVTGKPVDPAVELGKLAAFRGVAAYPVRVKCATLAWHTMRAALEGRQQSVSTE